MINKHYLDNPDMLVVQKLVAKNGLRPMVEAVAAAARHLLEAGEVVQDAYGDPIDEQDVMTAYYNLVDGDLY